MDHPAYALRAAVRTHLLAQSDVAALVTGLYESAPANAAYPYITFGDDRLRDWSTQSFEGAEHQLLINSWSDSHNFSELYDLHRFVRQHLSASSLVLAGHKLVVFFVEEERFLLDRRRKKRLGVLRYRALTQPLDTQPV